MAIKGVAFANEPAAVCQDVFLFFRDLD